MRAQMTALGVALVAFLAPSDPVRAVTIADLRANPDAYDHRVVTVIGTVEVALPVNGESGYELRDGPAKLDVLSRGSPPAVGDRLSVTGTVKVFHEGDPGEAESRTFPPFILESSRAPAP